MHPYLLLYKTLLPAKYRHYLQLANGDVDKCHETLLHGTFYEEYDLYGFASKNDAERREYLTDSVRDRICRRVNSRRGERIVGNKWETYKLWGDCFRRRVWLIRSPHDIKTVASQTAGVHELVAKPTNQCGGRGVKLICAEDGQGIIAQLEQTVLSNGAVAQGWMVEERIRQDERLARWNSDSVNTIRMNTFNLRGKVSQFTAFIRTGRQGSFVDNGAQGGLFASIDTTTGRIFTDGFDEHGMRHPSHPDSHVPFQGEQIPQWDALLHLTESMALRLPDMTYIGWDMALTPQGWALVEANRGEFVAQQTTQDRGLRREFERMCGLGKE